MRYPPISANEPPDRPLAGIAPDRLAHRQGRRPAGPRGHHECEERHAGGRSACRWRLPRLRERNRAMAAWAGAASSLPTGPRRTVLCSGTDRARRGQLCLHGHSGTAAPRVSPCVRSHLVPARGPREPDDPPPFGLPSRGRPSSSDLVAYRLSELAVCRTEIIPIDRAEDEFI